MLGKRRKLSPQELAFQHQLHQKQHYLKTQERLKAIDAYLTNMQTMLKDSAAMLAQEAYPLDGLTWLIEKGLPVVQNKVKREQYALQTFVEKQRQEKK